MGKWQAIIFDLDDTLYPERDYVMSGFRAVAAWAEVHLRISAGEAFAELRGLFERGVRGDTFDRWLLAHGFEPTDWVPQMVEVYRNHEPVLAPFTGVPELLSSLHQRYRVGLVSDGYVTAQRRKLAALGLVHHFDAIVFSGALGCQAWKPSLIPFRAVLERLANVAAVDSVYVADNPCKDFLGARQLGMYTIRVRHPVGVYADLDPPTSAHAPHVTLDSLEVLEDTVSALEAGR